ncbi:antitoxin AF2212-like protein [Thermococcus sp. JCM 11816]|uniref:antitoxin family protein n=1 Tax=Thermococcus sp. (strain JCM 11816 / KS-1) TaxID=1295125 RepID=UPI0006D07F84
MEKIVHGVYRSGEIILLDETELHEGEIIKVKLVGRKELVNKLAGVLGKGKPEDIERYLEEMYYEGSP